ncbi:unnamed protein product, partial [Hapterophycus canaliculatus]
VWREEKDPETGSAFCLNTSTLESRWQRPREMPTADFGHSGITVQSHLLANRPSSPHQALSEDKMSFVNVVPALMRAKKKWRALVDVASGSTYYVDESTGVSQWEMPSPEELSSWNDHGIAEDNDELLSTSFINQQDHQEGVSLVKLLPALIRVKRKWRTMLDDSTGSMYYVDEATGEAQWEKP